MNTKITTALAALALVTGLSASLAAPASAQVYGQAYGQVYAQVPVYSTWQPQWDRFQYDRRHVILGSVLKFWPYRVVVERPDGDVQTIDLKNGTVIHPTGATPMRGDRIAIYGYYSNGTFIANGLVLR
jgi:hypothetical protein